MSGTEQLEKNHPNRGDRVRLSGSPSVPDRSARRHNRDRIEGLSVIVLAWQAVDKAQHRWMRCPSTVENLGFPTGRPSGLSSIETGAGKTFSTGS
jgi:hypothetical protein